jgi:hypothetical protein
MTDSEAQADPTPATITDYIVATYPGTDVISTPEGDGLFFSLDPQTHWPNFATIVTSDRHDLERNSNLTARGMFRLNLGIGPVEFKKRFDDDGERDYTATDVLFPHPTYAAQRWVGIVNPSRATFDDQIKPLLEVAYKLVAPKGLNARTRSM